jgi:DTW domain-containing protein YfiP
MVTCWCAQVPSLSTTKTRVVFVQHPRERDTAIGTARMAHLALPGSRMIEALLVDEHIADVDAADVAVLFPGEDARPLADWLADPPKVLIVVDGTWSQARKLLRLNPRLASLPRLSYDPPTPGNYRIRKEPTDKHLSTIEATAAVLGLLEGDPARFATMLEPFALMVDRQLAATAEHGRRRQQKTRSRAGPLPELQALDPERAVVVYAEANCHPREDRAAGTPELIHLIASRPLSSSSSSFAMILKPRRSLHASVPLRLGLSSKDLAEGEDVDVGLQRFRNFLDDDGLVCWGPFARDLLVQEGERDRGFVDLRALVARTRKRAAGGVERAAREMSVAVDVDPAAPRAVRMHAGISALLVELHQRMHAVLRAGLA